MRVVRPRLLCLGGRHVVIVARHRILATIRECLEAGMDEVASKPMGVPTAEALFRKWHASLSQE